MSSRKEFAEDIEKRIAIIFKRIHDLERDSADLRAEMYEMYSRVYLALSEWKDDPGAK